MLNNSVRKFRYFRYTLSDGLDSYSNFQLIIEFISLHWQHTDNSYWHWINKPNNNVNLLTNVELRNPFSAQRNSTYASRLTT